jgi:hypothetical protein
MKYLHPGSSPAWLFLHSSFCVVSVVRITHINKSRVSEAIRITAKRILKPDALSYYYSRGYASPPHAPPQASVPRAFNLPGLSVHYIITEFLIAFPTVSCRFLLPSMLRTMDFS